MAETKAQEQKMKAAEPEPTKYYTPRSDVEILSDDNIIAEDMVPVGTFEVKYLKPGIRCRWVNWRTQEGLLMNRAQAEGYEFATDQDVETVVKMNKDRKILNGDVVLMKIPEARYASAMKALVLRTKMAAGATAEAALEDLKGLHKRSGGHLTPFAPDMAQLDRMIEANQAVTHSVTKS